MDKVCNQLFDKFINNIDNEEIKCKFNQKVIEPFIQKLYHKTYNYFMTIIILYGITIFLLLVILSLIITKKI